MSGNENPGGTMAGQVSDGDSFEVPLAANKNKIVCNPFPMMLDYSKLSFNGEIVPGYCGEGDDERMHGAPMIMNLIGSGYEYFYYINDATLDEEHDYEPVPGNNWADLYGIVLTDAQRMGVGGGFWLRTAKAGNAVFEK